MDWKDPDEMFALMVGIPTVVGLGLGVVAMIGVAVGAIIRVWQWALFL